MVERFLQVTRQTLAEERRREEERRRGEEERRAIAERTLGIYNALNSLLRTQGERVRGSWYDRALILTFLPFTSLFYYVIHREKNPLTAVDWRRFSRTFDGTGEPVEFQIRSSNAIRRPNSISISVKGLGNRYRFYDYGKGYSLKRDDKRDDKGITYQPLAPEDFEILENLLVGLSGVDK